MRQACQSMCIESETEKQCTLTIKLRHKCLARLRIPHDNGVENALIVEVQLEALAAGTHVQMQEVPDGMLGSLGQPIGGLLTVCIDKRI